MRQWILAHSDTLAAVYCRTAKGSFDHFVGGSKQRVRHGKAERLCGLEIDDCRVFVRRLHWQVSSLFALENSIDVVGRDGLLVYIGTVGDQATVSDVVAVRVDCGQFEPGS